MGAGGMNRGTRKFGVAAIYVRVDGQIFVIWTRRASRNVQFPFFFFVLSLSLFFLDTCPIFNSFPSKFFRSWEFLEKIFVLSCIVFV